MLDRLRSSGGVGRAAVAGAVAVASVLAAAGAAAETTGSGGWVASGVVVLASDRDGDGDVYAVAARGGRLDALTHNFDGDSVASSGRTIARQWRGSVYVLRSKGEWQRLAAGALAGVYDGGRRVAVGQRGAVLVLTADGRRRWRVRQEGSLDSVAPDGRHVAFYVETGDESGRYVLATVETGKRRQIPVKGRSWLHWAPDGGRVLIEADSDDGSGSNLLLDLRAAKSPLLKFAAGLEFGSWAPDGRSIVFTTRSADKTELVLADARTGKTWTPDVTGSVWSGSRSWSADGSRIAYRVSSGDETSAIVVTDVRGRSSQTVLAQSLDELVWSPDGQRLAYLFHTWNEDTQRSVVTLATVRRDGTAKPTLL
jgi:hypothetical protein